MTTDGRFLAAGLAAIMTATGLATAPALAGAEAAKGHAHGQAQQGEPGNPDSGSGNPPAHAGGPGADAPPPGQAREEGQPPPRPAGRPGGKGGSSGGGASGGGASGGGASGGGPSGGGPSGGRPSGGGRPATPASRPATPGRRPVTAAQPASGPAPGESPARKAHGKAGRTTICHATGSETDPYVAMRVSDKRLAAHGAHRDGRDLVPAPAGGCPEAAAAGRTASRAESAPGAAPAAAGGAVALPVLAETPEGVVLAAAAPGAAMPRLSESIAGERPVRELGSRAVPAGALASGGYETRLPFNGIEALLVGLLGVLLLLVGSLLRRLAQPLPAY